MSKRYGRKQPYTTIGIRRLPCARCGRKAEFQWNACSDENLWRPICRECDIDLNRMVLEWMGFEQSEVDAKIAAYSSQMTRPPHVSE